MEPRAIVRAPRTGANTFVRTGEWERLAVGRLAWMAGLATTIAVLGGLLALLRQPNVGLRAGTERPLIVVPVWGALSLAIFFLARTERISLRRRLDLGLVWLVVSCFLAGLFRHWLPYEVSDVVRGVSPVAIAALFFAVVVPVTPARMAVAATLAAIADGLALLATVTLAGMPMPPWNLWLWLLVPNAFVIVVAVVTSSFLHRLAETVREAREMGAYRLVSKLGSGGMGEVWRAEHTGLARPAAIKLVRPELIGAHDTAESQRMLTRFEREAKATAALTSPHTIGVYDFGRAEDGSFYYVMELLEGMDLESLVQVYGRVSQPRAVHILLQACDSLRDAHESGVIHRDIKPANLMVCRQGAERDFLKVLDFGLVKIEHSEDDAKLTDAGVTMGTPAYMPPEIAGGQDATPRSDIYALGCVAYWLVTGQLVFPDKPHPLAQVMAHANEAPAAPTSLVPEMDPALDALVLACLAKDPAERPQSMAEVERALLDTGLDGRWTRAKSDKWWENALGAEARDISMAPTLPQGAQAPLQKTAPFPIDTPE